MEEIVKHNVDELTNESGELNNMPFTDGPLDKNVRIPPSYCNHLTECT
jgi:hypothetical protein